METSLTPTIETTLRVERALTPSIWRMIWEMAPVMWKSRLFGVSSAEAAAAIMLKGFELGLSITASFEFVQVVQGRPGLSPRGALALLHNSLEVDTIQIRRLPGPTGAFEGYECYMKRRNGFDHTSRFTLSDAERAGVLKPNSGWANYPENMCLWRSVGFCADVVAPDITTGMTLLMKAPEQFGIALTQEGEIIDMTPALVANDTWGSDNQLVPESSVTHLPVSVPTITLESLLERYTAEQIIVANEGRIPGTDAEVAAVGAKLEAA